MRIIDGDRQHSVRSAQIYLTVNEAYQLQRQLARLLENPEACEHFHVHDEDTPREISCSLITAQKLATGGYNALEKRVFEER